MQIDKEAYTEWKEAPMSVTQDLCKSVHDRSVPREVFNRKTHSRSSADINPSPIRLATSDAKDSVRRTLTMTIKKSSRRINNNETEERRQSVFEVVDDIMNQIALAKSHAPCNISKSPGRNSKRGRLTKTG